MRTKPEFRCTRNQPYDSNCDGHTNIQAREGHYIQAHTEAEALARMAEKFPQDTQGFTATLFKPVTYPRVICTNA